MENELNSISILTLNVAVVALVSALLLQTWAERREDDDDNTGGEGGAPACP
jgi:hypothetical protein